MITALWLAAGPALASEIDVLPFTDTFPPGDIDGKGGWKSGYGNDNWPSASGGDFATPETDDQADNNDVWGAGFPLDNWLIQQGVAAVSQGGIEVDFSDQDNDACGVVFANSAGGNTYVAFWSDDQAPDPVGPVDQESLHLLRVENGVAVEVGDQNVGFDVSTNHLLRLERNGDHVVVSVDGGVAIDYLETSPLAAGFAGFWAYNNGDTQFGGGDTAYFDDVRIFQFDDDDDLVPDDVDNCEAVANADQADDDTDMIGNACDPDYVPPATTGTTTGTTDGDADTDSDSDSDADMDTDTDADVDTTGGTGATTGEVLVVGGGCDTGDAGVPLAGLALAAALALSRRRR